MKYYLIWLAIAVPVVTILFLGGFVVSSTTGGITFVVNSTADATDVNPGDGVCESGAGNGICTLRAAVQETNALPGADGIELPAGVYQLTIAGFDNIAQAGDLDITGSLLISGAGPAMTVVDGGALDRVFQLGSSATLVELSGLTIRNGYIENISFYESGSGVFVSPGVQVMLSNVDVISNTTTIGLGGGIYNLGMLTVISSRIMSNTGGVHGGAIYNDYEGDVIINNSSIQGNKAGNYGGGIYNNQFTTLNIYNSVIASNSTLFFDGGGIANGAADLVIMNSSLYNNSSKGNGGAITNGGRITITNSTLSGNTAPFAPNDGGLGGAIYNVETISIINSTIYSNSAAVAGGAFYNAFFDGGVITLRNSVVADNDGGNCAYPVNSSGHNIDSGNSCGLNGSGDLIHTDPQLGPLQDNGGSTWTHALLEDSPAIDTADNSGCPTQDQRGAPRPVDGDGNGSIICDIGAYEYGSGPGDPTHTPSPTSIATATATYTPTPSPSHTPTPTTIPSVTATASDTPTPTPSSTPTPSATPTAAASATPIPTHTPTLLPSSTPTTTPTAEPPGHKIYLPVLVLKQ